MGDPFLSDRFLDEIGLGEMSDDDRRRLRAELGDRLSEQVGYALSEGLSEHQLDEFGSLAEGDPQVIAGWLESNSPDFLADQLYLEMRRRAPNASDAEVLSDYCIHLWLMKNRPDYGDTVEAVRRTIEDELVLGLADAGYPRAALQATARFPEDARVERWLHCAYPGGVASDDMPPDEVVTAT